MPRQNRIVEAGLPHHVILRGNNRRRLFSYPGCYLRFLRYMGDALVTRACALHAFVLMSNHVHLLVTPAEAGDLSAFVKSVAQRYAVVRNRARQSSGKLFEQRFSSSVVRDDMHLAAVTAYIEMNPVRAGICSDPSGYKWSTFRLHAEGQRSSTISGDLWTPSPWYLSLGSDDVTRRLAFAEWMSAYRERIEQAAEPTRADVREHERYTLRLERPDRSSARDRALWMAYSRLPSKR